MLRPIIPRSHHPRHFHYSLFCLRTCSTSRKLGVSCHRDSLLRHSSFGSFLHVPPYHVLAWHLFLVGFCAGTVHSKCSIDPKDEFFAIPESPLFTLSALVITSPPRRLPLRKMLFIVAIRGGGTLLQIACSHLEAVLQSSASFNNVLW